MHNQPFAIEQLALLPLDSTSDVQELQTEVVEKVKRKGRPIKDWTGFRQGRLVVVSPTDERDNGNVVWLCKCDCGGTIKLSTASFRSGTRSCGCVGFGWWGGSYIRGGFGTKRKRVKSFERQAQANQRDLYSKYRSSAIRRGYQWKLPFDVFIEITRQDCHYCGQPPAQEHIGALGATDGNPYQYNGVDRMDNSKGYEIENVVACCGICNSAKMDRDLTDFAEWVLKVADKLKMSA
jgi:hypothetical protein